MIHSVASEVMVTFKFGKKWGKAQSPSPPPPFPIPTAMDSKFNLREFALNYQMKPKFYMV